jgi:hypothetical protein
LSRDPHGVTVADIGRLYLGEARDLDLLQRAMEVRGLPMNWKAALEFKARSGAGSQQKESV